MYLSLCITFCFTNELVFSMGNSVSSATSQVLSLGDDVSLKNIMNVRVCLDCVVEYEYDFINRIDDKFK